MILVIGQLIADRETFAPLYARLREMRAASRAEDGNIFYHMTIEDEDRGIILATECWRDMAALERHLAGPMVAEMRREFGAGYRADVKVYETGGPMPLTR